MSVVLPTPDVAQFQAFTLGDEHALRAIFRQEYDALIARAQESLGPELAHCSPRIVESAMLDTWAQRRAFSQPHGFVAYLETAVEEHAATQRRKHAALHHRDRGANGAHGATPVRTVTTPTPDDAVAALDARLHAPPPDHERLREEARTTRKHHAAEHVQAVGRPRPWFVPALLAVGAVAAIIGVQRWVGARGGDIAVTKALESADARDINSARGQRGTVTLGDDTRARIGSESSVRVPPEFGGAIRTVMLTGTARFEVAPGKPTPFTVRAANADITATGTAFTVRAYPDERGVMVTVDDGSVSVVVRDGSASQRVAAGDAVHIGSDGTIVPLASDARDGAFAWTRDSLVLENMPLRDVLPQLARWYDLKLALDDPALGNRPVSVRLGLQSSGAALDAVAKSAGLTHRFGNENRVTLTTK